MQELTLRDRFAIAALPTVAQLLSVMLSGGSEYKVTAPNNTIDEASIASAAYAVADAMLTAREVKL